MRLTFSLLAIELLLIGVAGCKKEEEAPKEPEETRWLQVTYDGSYVIWQIRDSIDITGWKQDEGTVYLWDWERGFPDAHIGYRYPWQGEDSIDYRYDEDGMLWVNGKMVAGSYSKLAGMNDSCYENILTLEADYYYFVYEVIYPEPPLEIKIGELKSFPNLSILEVDIMESHNRVSRIIDTLKKIPQDIDIHLSYEGATGRYIRRLSTIKNLKRLFLYSRDLSNWDLVQLIGAKRLERLIVLMEDKTLPWGFWILKVFLPDCDIRLNKY